MLQARTGSGAKPQPNFMGNADAMPPGIKRPGREADFSPPSMPTLRMSGAMFPLTLYVFMTRAGINLPLPVFAPHCRLRRDVRDICALLS
jgi:hypothetical protein